MIVTLATVIDATVMSSDWSEPPATIRPGVTVPSVVLPKLTLMPAMPAMLTSAAPERLNWLVAPLYVSCRSVAMIVTLEVVNDPLTVISSDWSVPLARLRPGVTVPSVVLPKATVRLPVMPVMLTSAVPVSMNCAASAV